MMYRVSYTIGGKRELSPKVFRKKETVKRAIKEARELKLKGDKDYSKVKNLRIVKWPGVKIYG